MKRFIPSPSTSGFYLGPFHIHLYAICILLGIVVAIALGVNRYESIGGDSEDIYELALWVVPSGIVGGRIYHLITSPDAYFGKGGRPLNAFAIWNGGLGIWGAIALGGWVAFWVFTRTIYPRTGHNPVITFGKCADALAPGIIFAQSIGRWGNWFNIELFGKPTKIWWGLEVPLDKRPIGYSSYSTFHPTFLYESVWCFVVGVVLIILTKKLVGTPGALFTLYIALYTIGRTWIEYLRIDPAHEIAGVRINVWVSLLLALLSISLFVYRLRGGKNRVIG